MTTSRSQSLLLIGVTAALCGSGCVYRSAVSTCRVWADYNTLMVPALFIEETDHLPYHARRVEHFRWLYNFGTLAQRHRGAVVPAATIVPRQRALPPHRPSVPPPSDLPAESPRTPEFQLPPLPSNLPRQLKSVDDDAAPAMPIPRLPAPQRENIDGPTASGNPLLSPSRH